MKYSKKYYLCLSMSVLKNYKAFCIIEDLHHFYYSFIVIVFTIHKRKP